MQYPSYIDVNGLSADPGVSAMTTAMLSGGNFSPAASLKRYGASPGLTAEIDKAMREMSGIAGQQIQTDYNLARTPLSAQLGWGGQLGRSNSMLRYAGLMGDQDRFYNQFAGAGQAGISQLLSPFLGSLFGAMQQQGGGF